MALKPTRTIRLNRLQKTETGAVVPELTPQQRAEQSHLNYIFRHPKYRVIIGAFNEGVKMTEIAAWFAKGGWLDTITEKTFLAYLSTFKRRNPDLVAGQNKVNSIDALVDANQPDIDVATELVRLIRLNKIRLKASVEFETQSNGGLRLDNETTKAVESTRVLLETLAKVQGKLGPDSKGTAPVTSSEGTQTLQKLREDEGMRDRLTGLTQQFIGALNHGSNPPKAKAKIRR